jgi:hypothetical protein
MAYTTLTPDWILMNLTTGHTCDVNNNASIRSINLDYHPLIIETLRSYDQISLIENDNIEIQYSFNADNIQSRCPETYAELIALKP